MLGAALDLNAARPAPWWQMPAYAAAEAGTGTVRLPALIASFRTGRYALTARSAATVPSDGADALALLEGTSFSSLFSFTRASTATYLDSGGRLQVAGTDAPRIDFSNGRRQLLLEGAATNSIPASEMTGFGTGRRYHDGVGNVGTLPTGMLLAFGGANTGYCDLISVATDSRGRKRLRLEFNIANATGSPQYPRFRFAEIAATAGDTWSSSFYANVVSTSHTIGAMVEAQAPTASMLSANLSTGENLVVLNGGVFPGAGQTLLRSQFGVTLPTGQSWTAIIEVACPQLEKSSRCTSYIPTTGVAASRAADSCQFGAKAQALVARSAVGLIVRGEGHWGSQGCIVGGAGSRIVGLNAGQSQILLGNSQTVQLGGAVTAPVPAFGLAAGWDAGGKSGSVNGAAAASAAVAHDATFTSAYLGRGSAFANGWYDELAVYPFRPSDAALVSKAVVASG
jgi:hypothetical protein